MQTNQKCSEKFIDKYICLWKYKKPKFQCPWGTKYVRILARASFTNCTRLANVYLQFELVT